MKKIILTESQAENLIEQLASAQSVKTAATVIGKQPLHIYSALRFLQQSSSTLTEKELGANTLATLSDVICEKAMRMGTCNPNMWSGKDPKGNPNKNLIGYHDFTTQYSKSPSYKKTGITYDQPSNIKELMLTLGGATVRNGGNGWIVNDVYNFDNIMEKKPHLKTDSYFKMGLNALRGLGAAIGGWILGRGATAGIEEMMSQLHNTGYQGYKVQINVPSNGCKCKKS
jgi:hypothetical protein